MSRLLLVTPAARGSLKGNRVTAVRWARLLRQLGHQVVIKERWVDGAWDGLIALHARRSGDAVSAFASHFPDCPIFLAMTGTDLYADIRRSKKARQSLDFATRLLLLQPHGIGALPPRHRSKSRVILQSAMPVEPLPPLKTAFEVCVSGHLRPVKDPFRAAIAARRLPRESQIRITHLGAALTPAMEKRALAEMRRNPRYHWLGEQSGSRARKLAARSRLLVVTSRMEGGANVVSESLIAGVPVLSTSISGSIGLLGAEYPGLFSVGNTQALTDLLRRCEEDARFYRELKQWCRKLARNHTPAKERAAWRAVLGECGLGT